MKRIAVALAACLLVASISLPALADPTPTAPASMQMAPGDFMGGIPHFAHSLAEVVQAVKDHPNTKGKIILLGDGWVDLAKRHLWTTVVVAQLLPAAGGEPVWSQRFVEYVQPSNTDIPTARKESHEAFTWHLNQSQLSEIFTVANSIPEDAPQADIKLRTAPPPTPDIPPEEKAFKPGDENIRLHDHMNMNMGSAGGAVTATKDASALHLTHRTEDMLIYIFGGLAIALAALSSWFALKLYRKSSDTHAAPSAE